MTITLYNYTGEKNRIDKTPYLTTLTKVGEYAGKARDAVDVVSPAVAVAADITAGNYAYLDTTGFYYWVESVNVLRHDYTILSLRRDPLTSFRSEIKACNCVCDRTAKASKGTFYVHDPVLRTNQYTLDETISLKPTDIFGYNGRTLLMTVG